MDLAPKNWLLIRGLSREARHWGRFPKLLEETIEGANVVAMELPGVGSKVNQEAFTTIGGYADDLRKDWLNIRDHYQGNWGVIAISMGGMIALDWSARYPQDLSQLILINSSAGNLSAPHHRFSPDAMGMVLKLFFREDYEEREEAILNLTTCMLKPTPDLIKEYASYSKESPIKRKTFLKQIYAASRFKVPSEINSGLCLIAAMKDKLASYKCSEALGKHFKKPVHYHEKAGHDLPLDDPEWIVEEIKSFLKETKKTTSSLT